MDRPQPNRTKSEKERCWVFINLVGDGLEPLREWSLFTAGGGRWKRGGHKIVVQAVGGGAKIWCTALEGGQNFSAQTSECLLQASKNHR